MTDIKKNIKRLLESELTAYQIQKETRINRSTITRLRNNETVIGDMKLDNAIALNNFWEENKMFNKLNKFNSTIIEFEGTELRTVDNPYLDDDVYKAIAVDQYDNQYEIVWEINHPEFDELEDESEACDWDNPVSVEKL